MASTVIAFSDMSPSPRVKLDIDEADLDPATDAVIVRQISEWGDVPVNRKPRAVAGGLVLTDYELPPGVAVTYRVEQFDAAGVSLGLALSLTAQVEVPFGFVVIQDPLAPKDAVLLKADPQFSGVLQRSRSSVVYQAGGFSFAMSGLYSMLQRVALRCFTYTVEQRRQLAVILEQPMILVRTHPDMRLPGSFYATSPVVAQDTTRGGRFGLPNDLWDFTGNEVSRPEIDIIIPIYTYDRFKAYLDTLHPPTPGTYDDAKAIWATYIDAMRNPPPEV